MPSDNDSLDFELGESDSEDPVLRESTVAAPRIDAPKSEFQRVCVPVDLVTLTANAAIVPGTGRVPAPK